MNEVRSHKDLEVWKVSMDFVIEIYHITKAFPQSEIYGLSGQIRRAAVSVPSNIAEGSARKNTKEYIQFLYFSQGSLSEIETQLLISEKLGYIKDASTQFEKIKYIRTLLSRLITALNKKLK